MNKLNFKFKLSIFAISILTLTISCEKEEIELTIDNQTNLSEKENNQKTLSFKDMIEFSEYMSLAQDMNTEDRIEWEKSNDFKSLATATDEFYNAIDFSSFSGTEDIVAFAQENSNFLTLIENSAGEYTLETKMYNHPERYVLNEHGLVIIGDNAFKRFDNKLVYTNLHSIESLKGINNDELSLGSTKTSISLRSASSTLKSGGERSPITIIDTPPIVVGNYFDNETINDKNKTYIEIFNWQEKDYVSLVGGGTTPRNQVNSYILIQPYKKVFGIWCKVRRTISCDFKVRYDIYNINTGTYIEKLYTYSNSGTLDYMIHKEFVPYNMVFGTDQDLVRIKAIDCWGDTPSTSRVYIQQNSAGI